MYDEVCFVGESTDLIVVDIFSGLGKDDYALECSDGFGYSAKEYEIEFIKNRDRRYKIDLLLNETK